MALLPVCMRLLVYVGFIPSMWLDVAIKATAIEPMGLKAQGVEAQAACVHHHIFLQF